jgi:hypothetical protein
MYAQLDLMLQLVNAHCRNDYSLLVNVFFEQGPHINIWGDESGDLVGRFLEITHSQTILSNTSRYAWMPGTTTVSTLCDKLQFHKY